MPEFDAQSARRIAKVVRRVEGQIDTPDFTALRQGVTNQPQWEEVRVTDVTKVYPPGVVTPFYKGKWILFYSVDGTLTLSPDDPDYVWVTFADPFFTPSIGKSYAARRWLNTSGVPVFRAMPGAGGTVTDYTDFCVGPVIVPPVTVIIFFDPVTCIPITTTTYNYEYIHLHLPTGSNAYLSSDCTPLVDAAVLVDDPSTPAG